MTTFKINFPMALTPYQYYAHDEMDFDSHLVNVQWDFSERFGDSPWSILLGDEEYYFEIGDLSYIWDELPRFLQECIDAHQTVVIFYFASQGTDTALLIEPSLEGDFLVSIEPDYVKHVAAGDRFDNPELQRVSVSKHHFFMEWRIFVDTMIRLLIEHNLITAGDPSIQSYLDLIPPE